MNIVVHSAHGVIFLDSVDCSGERKDGKYIFELVDKWIDEIGEEHVVQVVTDNASVNTTTSSLLRAKRLSIFWNGCAAHCLDVMLEDLRKLELVEQTISAAKTCDCFLVCSYEGVGSLWDYSVCHCLFESEKFIGQQERIGKAIQIRRAQ